MAILVGKIEKGLRGFKSLNGSNISKEKCKISHVIAENSSVELKELSKCFLLKF